MFYRLGIRQLLKNRQVMALSILAISLGVGILFTINISADTVQGAMTSKVNFLFGNVDYTVYRSGPQFFDNTSYGIPYTYMSTVKSTPGVDHVVARSASQSIFYAPDDATIYGYVTCAIDVGNPDERSIGIANVTSYDPSIGTGVKVLEDLLEWNGVSHPVVITRSISMSKGMEIGDKIRILPLNATKAYATLSEKAAAITKEQKIALEDKIRNNASRIEQFTVVGIIVDGSEGPFKAFAKDAESRSSLDGIVPYDEQMYVRMNDSFQWIFNMNDDEIAFFLVDTSSSYTGSENMLSGTAMTATGSAQIIANDIRAAFQGYIDYAALLIRIIMGMLTLSAWISCAFLIKTVTQMNIEERTRELGILMSSGFKKRVVFEIFTSQVAFMTFVGVGVGLVIGFIPPNFFNINGISNALSYNTQYVMGDVGVVVSMTSIIITLVTGILLPFISGLIPLIAARRMSIVEMMNPMYMQMKESGDDYNYPNNIKLKAWKRLRKQHRYFDARWIWCNTPHVAAKLVEREIEAWNTSTKFFERIHRYFLSLAKGSSSRKTMAWVVILGISAVAFYFGATHLFPEKGSFKFDLEVVWPWALATLGGIFFLLISVLQISSGQIRGISSFFAWLFKKKIGPISSYIPKSIHSQGRNIRNLSGFLTLGVVLVSSLVIVSDTIQVGNVAQNHSYLGGRMIVFNPLIPRSQLSSIRSLPGITSATTYTGIVMDNWEYNFDSSYSYIVNTVDDYGGRKNNVTQNLNVVIIEPEEYLQNNKPGSIIRNEFDPSISSLYEIDNPDQFESPSSFMHRLDAPMTTIVATSLLDTLGKDIGSTITVSINGFIDTFTIVGSASFLPGVPYMRLMDTNDGFYKTRSIVISRSTFASVLGNFVGNVDIMVKNMTIPNSLMNHSVSGQAAGYTSGIINMNAINSTIAAVPGVDKIAYRFSTFAPGAPSLNMTYNSSQLVWKNKNVTISQGEEFPLPFRMFVVNGLEDIWMTGLQEKVSEAIPWLSSNFAIDTQAGLPSGPRNHRASEVLRTVDKYVTLQDDSPLYNRNGIFRNTSICVVNRYVAAYEDIDNETYVYEMKPGNEITFSMEQSNGTMLRFNYTVAATLDNQIAYWWNNGSMREGFKLSSKSINYNFKENETGDLQNLFDVDGNVFITTRHELGYMAVKLFGSLAQFIGIDELGGISATELANHVQIKIKSGYNVTNVANGIRAALNGMPNGNYSVFEYKRAFIDKLANTGALAIEFDMKVSESTMIDTLKGWYESNGYTWNVAHVGSLERQNMGSDIGMANSIFNIFFIVSIFSLLISIVGLCTILYRNAKKRHREYGIYKAIGYTNQAIRDMIYFETFLVTFIGSISGMLAGISIMAILFESIKSTLILPMMFSIPIFTILSIFFLLIVISAITSRQIANHFTKLSTVEAIRYRE